VKIYAPYNQFKSKNHAPFRGWKESGIAMRIGKIASDDRGLRSEDIAYNFLTAEVRDILKAQGIEYVVQYLENAPGKDFKIIFEKPENLNGKYLFLEVKGSFDGIQKHRSRGYQTPAIIVNSIRNKKEIIRVMAHLILRRKRNFEEQIRQSQRASI